jgi:hypothetical protein
VRKRARAPVARSIEPHHGDHPGRTLLSAEIALRLGQYFGTGAAFRINLQAQYDLATAERKFQGVYALQSKAGWRPRQPERGRWKKPLADGEIRGEGQGIWTLAVDARCWPFIPAAHDYPFLSFRLHCGGSAISNVPGFR